MATVKSGLKAAKAAIDAQKFDDAVKHAQAVLALDPQSYFANLFLGRASDKLGRRDDAAKAYECATRIKPTEDQAWLGLRSLYEAQGAAKADQLITVSLRLAQIYEAGDDLHRSQTAVNKAVEFARSNGSKSQYKTALKIQLPSSPIYPFLEGRLPHPSHTYLRIVEITEEEEKERINKEIGERRTRLGARKEQVTADVKREVYGQSELEELYQAIIEWSDDDTQRREFEEKKLQRAYEHLLVLPKDQKKGKLDQVMKLAHDMVIIKHPYLIAWTIELEWQDVEEIGAMDGSVLRQYINFFPDQGLSSVLSGYLSSSISPFPPPVLPAIESDSEEDEGGVLLLTAEDRLVLMNDGLVDAKLSPLAHRLIGEFYQHLEEHEIAVETTRIGIKLCKDEARKSGLKLQNNLDAMHDILATALIKYQTPKNHPEAKSLFEDILKRKPYFTPALIGVGLILEEEEEYAAALDYLVKALKRDPENIRIGAEAAWCRALNGDLTRGLEELEGFIDEIDGTDSSTRELRAETLYRIGRCQWDLDPSRTNRKDRKGPYAKFLASVKANINYAPAYTSLGIYYADYGRDVRRARQCFQKAFDLSASEIEAAERLARSFAVQGDWEIVEIVAQRVVDSGKARPPPGSNKKGISWPYSALGVVQMNRQDYQKAIVSFLAALRISPDDYHSYVGLGESYHNSGRYNSALRTFKYAESPDDGKSMKKSSEDWFTNYMLANVNRELGAYDEAILAYREVLDSRKQEFGVEIALLQTLLEHAWRSIESGFFGRAVDSATQSLEVASAIVQHKPAAFNLWKAVADACSVFSSVQDRSGQMPFQQVRSLLEKDFDLKDFDSFSDVDGIGQDALRTLEAISDEQESKDIVTIAITAAILSQKRALACCIHDIHAQAVAWYNLGWTEYRAHVCIEERPDYLSKKPKKATKFLKASVRCFKRAIELEAGNYEFWNALGVVTTRLNAKVAQHSFVRSLHLNERNPKAWTNLGALYLLQNDHDLAHAAFTRAQSTDPDYAHAWMGEGVIALLLGDQKEALMHFTHAFDISESSTTVVKKDFAVAAFDELLTHSLVAGNALQLIQPLLALRQLRTLNGVEQPFDHLSALYNERIGAHSPAIQTLTTLCATLESSYEETELPNTLNRFAQAKADLARNHLAAHQYEEASTEAQVALDLTSDVDGDGTVPEDSAHRIRLSARLTVGLAKYHLNDMDAALAAFRAALEETKASPNVICLLAEVLWAKGGEDERTVAKEQLFDCVSRGSSHAGPVILLGVMAAIEGDSETIDAVREELESFRIRDDLDPRDTEGVERVLEGIVELEREESMQTTTLYEMQKNIMLVPWASRGWSRMADFIDGEYPARMALTVAQRNIPPRGVLDPEGLAEAFIKTGVVGDAQRAVMIAPWKAGGWMALADAVAYGSV